MNNDKHDILKKILFELVDIMVDIKRELRKCNGQVNKQADSISADRPMPEDAEIMLLGFIQRHGKVSKSQITYRMQAIGNSDAINKVLDDLISKGAVRMTREGRTRFYMA